MAAPWQFLPMARLSQPAAKPSPLLTPKPDSHYESSWATSSAPSPSFSPPTANGWSVAAATAPPTSGKWQPAGTSSRCLPSPKPNTAHPPTSGSPTLPTTITDAPPAERVTSPGASATTSLPPKLRAFSFISQTKSPVTCRNPLPNKGLHHDNFCYLRSAYGVGYLAGRFNRLRRGYPGRRS